MNKRQLIDEITTRNPTAKPEFLARFVEADLGEYLDHLIVARRPRLSGGGNRYAKYFVGFLNADCVGSQATRQTTLELPEESVDEVEQTVERPLEPVRAVQPALFQAAVNSLADEDPIAATVEPETETPAQPQTDEQEKEYMQLDQPLADIPASSYQAELAPAAVTKHTDADDSPVDDIDTLDGLQYFHDDQAPPVDKDETHDEEAAAENIFDEEFVDKTVGKTAEKPVEEVEESAEETEPVAKSDSASVKPVRQMVAVGAETNSDDKENNDSWLF